MYSKKQGEGGEVERYGGRERQRSEVRGDNREGEEDRGIRSVMKRRIEMECT